MTTSVIDTRGLGVRFGDFWGIRDLDLEVHEGEVFGFLGKNGAGKSTTIKLLLDLLRPDEGEARLFGAEVRSGGGALRREVGFLPGDLALFAHLTGRATLELFSGLQERPPVRRDEILERLGFPAEALERRVGRFSTGMRQVIGITLALQHDPRLAILDEPTTGLDPVVREAFLELVRSWRGEGKTVFLSSHVLEEIERTADRVAFVRSGRLELVESIQRLRETMPREVRTRYEGGEVQRFFTTDAPADILESIDREGLLDVEIRPAGLDEFFRADRAEVKP